MVGAVTVASHGHLMGSRLRCGLQEIIRHHAAELGLHPDGLDTDAVDLRLTRRLSRQEMLKTPNFGLRSLDELAVLLFRAEHPDYPCGPGEVRLVTLVERLTARVAALERDLTAARDLLHSATARLGL